MLAIGMTMINDIKAKINDLQDEIIKAQQTCQALKLEGNGNTSIRINMDHCFFGELKQYGRNSDYDFGYLSHFVHCRPDQLEQINGFKVIRTSLDNLDYEVLIVLEQRIYIKK